MIINVTAKKLNTASFSIPIEIFIGIDDICYAYENEGELVIHKTNSSNNTLDTIHADIGLDDLMQMIDSKVHDNPMRVVEILKKDSVVLPAPKRALINSAKILHMTEAVLNGDVAKVLHYGTKEGQLFSALYIKDDESILSGSNL